MLTVEQIFTAPPYASGHPTYLEAAVISSIEVQPGNEWWMADVDIRFTNLIGTLNAGHVTEQKNVGLYGDLLIRGLMEVTGEPCWQKLNGTRISLIRDTATGALLGFSHQEPGVQARTWLLSR